MATPNPEFSPDELAELLSAHMPDIPGYRVMRRLGQGGMSYVYLGVQESLDRQVAIKVIDPVALKDEISKLRFEREARTIAKLQHPSIVAIYEVGRSDVGLLYYVMPYLPRGHLGQRDLREDEPGLIAVLRAMLWALDYAHERGIVHRDLKPENVLFDNVDRPLLTDFGIAMHRADRRRVTGGGFALGSSTHMAPEQARGEKVDGRADLYAIGVLTYELLTGSLPFQADDPLSLAVKHAVDPVPRLPLEKAHWQPFIDRALAKTADARFASAREMSAALDRLEFERRAVPAATAATATGVAATPAPIASAPLRSAWFLGRPRFLAVAGALVLFLAVLVAVLAWRSQPTLAPDPPAVAATPSPALAARPAAPVATQRAEAQDPAPASGFESSVIDQTDEATASLEPSIALAEADADAQALAAEAALPADERALSAAARQIPRLRLTLPPGDNARESLLAAQALQADPARLRALGEAWLTALHPYVARSFAGSPTSPDRRLYDSAAQLATALQLRQSAAWRETEQVAIGWLRGQLQVALIAQDLAQLRAAKAAAASFGVAPSRLDPEWSQPLVLARVGDRLPGPIALHLLRLPRDNTPGLAATATVVSRGDYARFAAATQRAAAPCRVRTALMTLRKRSWSAPGFAQDDRHPVVCVSLADAEAYAAWRGARDGQRYRLAGAEEWTALFAVDGGPAACGGAGHRCGRAGTLALPSTDTSLQASQGNVREWTAGCRTGCRRQPVQGNSWRDAERGELDGPGEVAAENGYDDVGFRLLREVSASELEQR